jgi:hypothetical protein
VTNHGLYDLQTDGQSFSGGTFNNENDGIFRKSLSTGLAIPQGFFNNHGGTIDVQRGTLDLRNISGTHTGGTFYTADGTTLILFGGTFTGTYTGAKAGSGVVNLSTLTVGTGGAILDFEQDGMLRWSVTNIIVGPDGLINNGSLTLIGSSSHFLMGSGGLTNNGTVILTAGTTLRVDGDYTQSGTGTLDVQFGGTPASGQFGKLVVGGTATLAGTLRVDLVSPDAGMPGAVYTILTYGSGLGDFDNVILPPGAGWDVNTGTVTF